MAEQDFLVRIRTAEKQAADLLEQARMSARAIQDEARERAVELISLARLDAARTQQAAVESARIEAEQIQRESLLETESGIIRLRQASTARLEQAARLVAERIVGSRGDR